MTNSDEEFRALMEQSDLYIQQLRQETQRNCREAHPIAVKVIQNIQDYIEVLEKQPGCLFMWLPHEGVSLPRGLEEDCSRAVIRVLKRNLVKWQDRLQKIEAGMKC